MITKMVIRKESNIYIISSLILCLLMGAFLENKPFSLPANVYTVNSVTPIEKTNEINIEYYPTFYPPKNKYPKKEIIVPNNNYYSAFLDYKVTDKTETENPSYTVFSGKFRIENNKIILLSEKEYFNEYHKEIYKTKNQRIKDYLIFFASPLVIVAFIMERIGYYSYKKENI